MEGGSFLSESLGFLDDYTCKKIEGRVEKGNKQTTFCGEKKPGK